MKAVFEKVDIKDSSTISAFQYTNDNFEAPWHFHPEYELTYIVKSSGTRYVGNHIASYEPNDLVFLGPNLPHCWKNDVNLTEKATSIVIQWPEKLINGLPEFKNIINLLKMSQRGLLFDNFPHEEVHKSMLEIVEASTVTKYLKLIALLNILSDLPEMITLAGNSYALDLSNDTNRRIDKVQRFVSKNYDQKIKLKRVADELHMTEQSFSRFFSKTMQRPFFIYLNEYRVNFASRLLLETDLHVKEIGYKCGYESLPFFYQQFKKFKGYSPLAFRKMYRKI
jgi:AraC-like DNA-binding protein/mannose-6-phosphate isomerase-like protein (cupin superfamily)